MPLSIPRVLSNPGLTTPGSPSPAWLSLSYLHCAPNSGPSHHRSHPLAAFDVVLWLLPPSLGPTVSFPMERVPPASASLQLMAQHSSPRPAAVVTINGPTAPYPLRPLGAPVCPTRQCLSPTQNSTPLPAQLMLPPSLPPLLLPHLEPWGPQLLHPCVPPPPTSGSLQLRAQHS